MSRDEVLQRVIDAQESERARVARDLHDEIGQALTSVLLGLRLVDSALKGDRLDVPRAIVRTTEVRELVADALRRVRRLAFDLRPAVLDDLGLVPALERLAGDLRERYDLAVALQVSSTDPDVRLPAPVETVVYRVVQEALTNVVRHADATRVSVDLTVDDRRVRALVEDDGHGFDVTAATATLGLRGMVERATLAGGNVAVHSVPGHGTRVDLEVPHS